MKNFKEYLNESTNLEEEKNYGLDHNPCEKCGGKCCQEMHLDQGPLNEEAEDAIKWAKSHEGVRIFIAESDNGDKRWGVKINSKCKHLTENGKCAIQDHKPKGCKDFIGLTFEGPMLECNLIKELILNKKIECKKEWIEKLWPNDPSKKKLLNS